MLVTGEPVSFVNWDDHVLPSLAFQSFHVNRHPDEGDRLGVPQDIPLPQRASALLEDQYL